MTAMSFADYDCDICEEATDHVAPVIVKGRRLMACPRCQLAAIHEHVHSFDDDKPKERP